MPHVRTSTTQRRFGDFRPARAVKSHGRQHHQFGGNFRKSNLDDLRLTPLPDANTNSHRRAKVRRLPHCDHLAADKPALRRSGQRLGCLCWRTPTPFCWVAPLNMGPLIKIASRPVLGSCTALEVPKLLQELRAQSIQLFADLDASTLRELMGAVADVSVPEARRPVLFLNFPEVYRAERIIADVIEQAAQGSRRPLATLVRWRGPFRTHRHSAHSPVPTDQARRTRCALSSLVNRLGGSGHPAGPQRQKAACAGCLGSNGMGATMSRHQSPWACCCSIP